MRRKTNICTLAILVVSIFCMHAFPKTSEISLIGTTLPDIISVGGGFVDDIWRDPAPNIPLQEYIRGVVRSEMGLMKKDDNYAATIVEAYKAQAIAAATNLKERVKNQTTAVIVPNSAEEFQTYLSATSFASYPKTATAIEGVVDENTAKTIVTYDGAVASIRYFHGTESGFTLNSNECSSNGRWYNPYMSRQVTPEKLQNEYPLEPNYSKHAGDGCGMSQVGAVQLALMGRNYEGILKYYYGTMPPYVKSVAVTQDGAGNFKYKAAIADNVTDIFGAKDKNSTTRKWDPKEEGAIK